MRPFASPVVAVVAAIGVALAAAVPSAVAQSPVPPNGANPLTADARDVRADPAKAVDSAGPRRAAARSGVSPILRLEPPRSPAPVFQESRRRNGQILTIVGGAIFLAGMLMDDDDVGTVVALGGLAVGVYGLIQWLQASVAGTAGAASVTNVSSP